MAAPALLKRYGKLRVFMAGSAIVAVLYIARHFIPLGFVPLFVAASFVGSFGRMLCSITQWGLLPDTVEYGHYQRGIRSERIPFGFFSFMQKLGMAMGGAVGMMVLQRTGYTARQAQSPEALRGIAASFNLIPAAFSVLCLGVLFLYRLDGERFEHLKAELARGRFASAAAQ